MMEAVSLCKTYQGRRVLNIPALSLLPGESYALLGANGSGKSTLLRMLAGVLPPDTGREVLPKEDAWQVGYLPQRPYGFQMSVVKNVALALPPSHPQPEAAALAALRRVGMENMAGENGSRLSGGETQRMAFARMIVQPRKLLLLDEPTSATDIAGNDLVEAALLEYQRETGCTVLMATHSLAQAARLCQRMIFLHQGEIAAQGPIRQLLDAPEDPHLREFLAHWRI
jgi:tungstate transport system ATP-binding protein